MIDLNRLRPTTLARLLNSTPVGTAVTSRKLRDLRTDAGYRIGDDKTVSLYRLCAFLCGRYQEVKAPARKRSESRGYDAMKERARDRNVSLSKSGRDIGPIPPVKDPERRAACEHDHMLFCTTYFPNAFYLEPSPHHYDLAGAMQTTITHGGSLALGLPRGSGKSEHCEKGTLKAALYGHRTFPIFIGPRDDAARESLTNIKRELETNDLLLEDFPEICYPIRCLEGISQRARGQLYQGERTHMKWAEDELIFPWIPGALGAGAIIRVAGLTGRIRGHRYVRPDGVTARPDIAIIDDPQTKESARSKLQSDYRADIIASDALYLGAPGKKIAVIMPCTVIEQGDMADQLLDRGHHPEWRGRRVAFFESFPTNERLWSQYERILREDLETEAGPDRANAFYLKHRKAMDKGAKVYWEARFDEDEHSAIQHGMNWKIRDERAFFAELQNDPKPRVEMASIASANDIVARTNNLKQGKLPLETQWLTVYIDIQDKALWWVATAWRADFTGAIVDYGTFPEQTRPYFTNATIPRTLGRLYKGAGREARILQGLTALCEKLQARKWTREDNAKMPIAQTLIDANWGQSTDIVYQFCRRTELPNILPAHGQFVGASSKPYGEYKRVRGERRGLHWRIMPARNRRGSRYVLIDTNYWKSATHERLIVAMGDPGSLTLFGNKPAPHRMLADQLTSEYPTHTEAKGRAVDEWKLIPDRDNHWLDCLVGSAVAASIAGARLPGQGQDQGRRKRVSFAEMQQKKKRRRA